MINKYGLHIMYRTHTHTKLSSIGHHHQTAKIYRVEHGDTKHPLTKKKSLSYDHLHHKLNNLQPRHRLHSFTYKYIFIHT